MIKLENVSKYYYSSSSVTCALRKINLEFNLGEFVAITGESGSGKTTLMNMLAGIYYPDEGKIYVNGEEVMISSPESNASFILLMKSFLSKLSASKTKYPSNESIP